MARAATRSPDRVDWHRPPARGARNPTGLVLAPKGHPMDDFLQLALFVAGWILLQRVILPKLGVPG